MTLAHHATPGFGLDHLPYGSFSHSSGDPSLGVRVGDVVIDLRAAAKAGLVPAECDAPNLNRLLAAAPATWSQTRTAVKELVERSTDAAGLIAPLEAATLHLPIDVADYVDFYSSESHATNVGMMFRPDSPPLLPNWKHLPVGYHGRAGTIVVSGTPISRPQGQRREPGGGVGFGPSNKLDVELEMAVVLGNPTQLGEAVPIEHAADHIFGIGLLNDWSARDIQAWEYVPLGPFLGKSFATTLSAWITPMPALEAFRVSGPAQDPAPLPYLAAGGPWAFDLELDVALSTEAMRNAGVPAATIATANFRDMYWTMAQQLAHMTVNGATVRPGDVYASGTISGPEPGTFGSLLELTWNGRDAIELPDGTSRTFLEAGDEVVLSGRGRAAGTTLELGRAAGTIIG